MKTNTHSITGVGCAVFRFAILAALALPSMFAVAQDSRDPASARDGETIQLFDGKTFDGWEGNNGLFRISDGAIIAGNLTNAIPANAFLCTTDEYDNFELHIQVKLLGPGDNAGVQFRTRRVPDHHEVSGYQADVGTVSRTWFNDVIGRTETGADPDAKSPVWGSLYDESRRDRYLAWALPELVTPILKTGDWNEMVVRSDGPVIKIFLNGVQTVDYLERSHIPQSGVICLQVHSGAPTEVWHRDITLTKLNGVSK